MSAAGDVWRSPCGRMELRCGDYREVLADVERVDAVITDPPYTARVEAGTRSGSYDGPVGGTIGYGSVDAAWLGELVVWAVRVDPRWLVAFNDHVGWAALERAAAAGGLYTFAPVPWCKIAAAPRFAGDGPATAAEFILVARPRAKLRAGDVGSRPGFYLGTRAVRGAMSNGAVVVGGKPVDLMRALIRDYSRPGDLICDPCAGGGTTLLAAAIEGRRAIGAEIDPATFDLACKRLAPGYTPQFDFAVST